MSNEHKTEETENSVNATPERLSLRARAFARDEDGSLIIFGVFMFCMMMVIAGLSFDLMRYESQRSILQNTSDRAALAAASLTQSLNPNDVVADYFAKAGLSQYLESVDVTDEIGARIVAINTVLNVPLHFGHFNVFGDADADGTNTLVVNAQSTAMEAIGDVEISMVLDVSGSMGSYNRLNNLKTASENFIDTVYNSAETGTISTSVVPYAEQVSAGPVLLSHYTIDDGAHTNSFCINFAASDYSDVALSTTAPLQQTLHFDPWTDDNYWRLNVDSNTKGADPDPLAKPVCRPQASRRIMAWEMDPDVLKAHINSFYSGGNTSTDIGLKWGTALLDPGSQGILDSMINLGDVSGDLTGRPAAYNDGETMKIIVVMSDGENTSQHYMDDPYRTGDTDFFRYVDNNGEHFFSVWAGDGPPVFEPPTSNDWYRVNEEEMADTPYGIDDGVEPTRLSWTQLWAIFPIDEMTDEVLPTMGGQGAEISAIENARKKHVGSVKNTRMAAICTAAKNAGITIFAVALDTNDNAAGRLQTCASSPAHFFRVTGTGINFAFQAIASQINQLRLVH